MKTTIIAAFKYLNDGRLGIGNKGSIPWNCSEDLKFFKEQTIESTVIMGRKTFESLGNKPLKNRRNIVLSKNGLELYGLEGEICPTLSELKKAIKDKKRIWNKYPNMFVIGGEEVYKEFLDIVEFLVLTEIIDNSVTEFDTFFPFIPYKFFLHQVSDTFTSTTSELKYRHLFYTQGAESKIVTNIHDYDADAIYKNLLETVLENGNTREDRTGTGTVSLFGKQLVFDITNNRIPILTTKKVAWKTCVKELLWFLRGETDSKVLEAQGVNIWKGNTSREFLDSRGLYTYPEGELGPGYGWQIRRSGETYNKTEVDATYIQKGFDQLDYIESLLKTDPFSRRILWNLWNPYDLDKMALVPCHYSFQLYVEEAEGTEDIEDGCKDKTRFLSGILTQRSQDIFLGGPFNYISYAILINILALKCGMKPKTLFVNTGDAHIYKNHLEQVNVQLSRPSRSQPVLVLDPSIIDKDYADILPSDINLLGYYPDSKIPGAMAV